MTVDNPTVAEMIADPEFATNPAKFVAYCSQRAADAAILYRRHEALDFASMAAALAAAADSPHVKVGLAVTDILDHIRPDYIHPDQ